MMPSVSTPSRGTGTPLYRQIAAHLETELAQSYSPGDQLPVESELARRFDVNRLTVRKAMDELARRGLVRTVHGKGSFRRAPATRYEVAAGARASFSQTMINNGHRVSARLLQVRVDHDEQIQAELGTELPLRRTDMLRLVDDQPWSLTSTWTAPERFPGLDSFWDGSSSLFTVLEHEYGVRMHRAHRSFAALPADSLDAQWLELPVAAPILQVRGLNVDEHGRPVAFVEHRYSGERLQFSVELRTPYHILEEEPHEPHHD